MADITDQELLDQYLREELSQSDRTLLENRLTRDTILQKQLQELQEVQQGIRLAQLGGLLQQVKEWEQESNNVIEEKFEGEVSDMIRLEKNLSVLEEIRQFDKTTETPSSPIYFLQRYWRAVAASVLLIIGMGWFYWQTVQPTLSEQLLATYFEPYPPIGIQRDHTSMTSEETLRAKEYGYYNTGNYAAAIPTFEQLHQEYQDTLSLYYQGIPLLGNHQYEAAIEKLSIVKNQHTVLESQANWYLFLSYVGKGKTQEIHKMARELNLEKHTSEVKNILEHFALKE